MALQPLARRRRGRQQHQHQRDTVSVSSLSSSSMSWTGTTTVSVGHSSFSSLMNVLFVLLSITLLQHRPSMAFQLQQKTSNLPVFQIALQPVTSAKLQTNTKRQSFSVDSSLSSSTKLHAATGLSLDGATNSVSGAEQQQQQQSKENENVSVGVLFLNLGGPATGEDVEGR